MSQFYLFVFLASKWNWTLPKSKIHTMQPEYLTPGNENYFAPAQITKREVLRSHRADPMLVETLLLALEVTLRLNQNKNPFSMHRILGLCQFHQLMRWLCPWGEEQVNEVNRPPGFRMPFLVHEKYFDNFRGRVSAHLTCDALKKLFSDRNQHWDRVYIGLESDPSYFELLHLHPCEELYTCSLGGISVDDAHNAHAFLSMMQLYHP